MDMPKVKVLYSPKYEDGGFIYRYVTIPKDIGKLIPKNYFMFESEWRKLGIRIMSGWVLYQRNYSAPHILLFRRRKQTKPTV